MYNLVVKDILIQKKRIILCFAYVLFMVITFQNMGEAMFPVGVTACTYLMIMTACAYEDLNKSDIMMNSLPVKRSRIVAAKYLSVFIFFIMGSLVYIAFYCIIKVTGIPFHVYPVNLNNFISGILTVSLMAGIYLPIFFKVGYVKSKVINFVLFFLFFYGASFLVTAFQRNTNVSWLKALKEFILTRGETVTAFILLILIFIFLLISYSVAVRFYRQREF